MAVFLLLFCLGAGIAILAAAAAAFSRKPRIVAASIISLFMWTALYFSALGWASYSSAPHELPPHEEHRLRGFMLDPHFLFSVDQVRQTDHLPKNNLQARGVFYVISIRYRSDAARAELRPPGIEAKIVDAEGRITEPIEQAGALSTLGPGERDIFELVFDLPRDVREPRLLLRSNDLLDRWLGRLIIDGEESLGPGRTTFQIPPTLAHSVKGE